jgi:hypothetical protein
LAPAAFEKERYLLNIACFFLDIPRQSATPAIMKLKRAHLRKSAAITNSRWLAYATAGAASAFIRVNSAEGMIHYSGLIHHEFNGYSQATFRLGHGARLSFWHSPPSSYSTFTKLGGSAYFNILATGGSVNGFVTCVYNTSVASVSNLSRGVTISAQPFVPGGGVLASGDSFACGGNARGQFVLPGIGFVGFKFNNGNGDQYGWARIRALGYLDNKFELIYYAYGDVGDPIRVGQRAGGHGPEVESLSGLALGAAGLLAWRRRQSKATVAFQPRE